MEDKLLQRIVIDRAVMASKPVIRGTHIPVELIVRMLSEGIAEERPQGAKLQRFAPKSILN